MLQQIRIANWLLEVDFDKTRAFYSKDLTVCNCLYCENYVEACKDLKTSISDVFTRLGINPTKPAHAHLSQFSTEETMTRIYSGNYHLVGKVLEGELSTSSNWNETTTTEIKNFIFGFSNDLEFVPGGFPNPILQLDFEADIPWVLDEKPDEI